MQNALKSHHASTKSRNEKKSGKENDPDGLRIWLLLIKSYHSLLECTAHTLRASGLGDSDFRVLEALLHKGPLPVNTIGAKVFLAPGSISVAVDRLLHNGLVTRDLSTADRRVRMVSLTTKGRDLIEQVFAEHAAQINALTAEMPGKERRRLADSLKWLGKRAAQQLPEQH
ncbi:MAG: MarR family winged helix-turn-helix transcriptional regulator [Acidobacteriaceae bacterium]|nr:MarR family winged helix-turn-helix transcriptional regulator [Acidobacteriaceae bacterium]